MDTVKLNINRIQNLYWDKKYNIEEIAQKLDVSVWSLYNFIRKNNMPRRSTSEVNYIVNKNKPQFKIKENLNILEEKLKIAGIMLYWAEGTLKGETVDFANSNPEMIEIFLKFLREICGVNEQRLRIYLYAYSYQNIDELKKHWHKVTNIPISQFTKPYIREGNPNLSGRKLPYGLIHIRYNDKRLLELIRSWIDEFIGWAGGGVANRTRLWITQHPEEIQDEKVGEFREAPTIRQGNPEPSAPSCFRKKAGVKVQRLSAHHLKQNKPR